MLSELEKLRSREFFICVNKGAKCYDIISSILKVLKLQFYAYIVHNPDIELKEHIHLIIKLKDAKSYNRVCQLFSGAHVEICDNINLCCKYLLHIGATDKVQYSIDSVISNDISYFEKLVNTGGFVKIDTDSLISDIESGVVFDIVSAIKRYGIFQVNRYRVLIVELLKEYCV